MMFCRIESLRRWARAAIVAAVALAAPAAHAATGMGYAVVPTTTIYPGETISGGQLAGGRGHQPEPGRRLCQVHRRGERHGLQAHAAARAHDLRFGAARSYTVTRGSNIRLVFKLGAMAISAAGTPLEDG
jgi:flagella basal body P-ring formation protein FlgA